PYGELGFGEYLRQDGMTYRLVPVKGSETNVDWAADKMLNRFRFGNADMPGVYFDEENRRHLNGIRMAFAQAASAQVDAGKPEVARALLQRIDSMMLQENMPYGMVSRHQQHNQKIGRAHV